MKKNYLAINLNEINLTWLKSYSSKFNLQNINKLLKLNFTYTTSEKKYENLEPWIQWPTYYLGKSFKNHKCFHLGDADSDKQYSIYNYFQDKDENILALSPMNCSLSTKNDSLFVHDPWSKNGVCNGHKNISLLWEAICFFVNENSNNSFKIRYALILLINLFRFARFRNYFTYTKLLFLSFFYKWPRAIFLDLFLFDIYYSHIKSKKYKFSSIFLNAGAHIQHHYLYDSYVYKADNGKFKNPLSYSSRVTKILDPIYQIYKVYDHIAYDILYLAKDYYIDITSGLQQIENKRPFYQYRIKNYEDFLKLFKISYNYFEKKMSRDVYIYFRNKTELKSAQNKLSSFFINKKPLFKIWITEKDNSMFLKVFYQGDFSVLEKVNYNKNFFDFRKLISIVSIENSIHKSEGWHINNFYKFNKKKIPLQYLTKYLYGFKPR